MGKILYIHHSGLIGGAGISMVNTIAALSKNNTVTLYVPESPSDMNDYINTRRWENPITVRTYPGRIGAITYYSGGDHLFSARFWYRASLIFVQWKRWNQIIEKENPDLIIVNSKILCWMSKLPAMKKRKSICYVRETMKKRKEIWMNKRIKNFLNQFTCCIFISDYDRKLENVNCLGITVHNYVDSKQFNLYIDRNKKSEILGLDNTKFHVLYVGGVSAMKGFDIALKSILEAGPDVDLLVCGNNFEEAKNTKDKKQKLYVEKWKKYIIDKKIENRIYMYGKQKDMSCYYAACDLLIFPMRSPHQARPVIEAGIFKKPVIITDFENIHEFVEENYNGYKIKVDDIEGFAEKIRFLKDNKKELERMGENNYSNSQQKHNADYSINRICELAESLIRKI